MIPFSSIPSRSFSSPKQKTVRKKRDRSSEALWSSSPFRAPSPTPSERTEDRVMKKASTNPGRIPINLKQIPPLIPTLIDNQPSHRKPSTPVVPTWVVKRSTDDGFNAALDLKVKQSVKLEEDEREEDGVFGSLTKHIDPNSTRIVESIWSPTPEKDLVLETKLWTAFEPGTEIEPRMQIEPRKKVEPRIQIEDSDVRLGYKAKLHELCAAKHWNAPVFECCEEEGPCHMKSFTYKVVIELGKSSSSMILECYGAPLTKKKTAAESAAEGALWYLKHLGHFPFKRRQH